MEADNRILAPAIGSLMRPVIESSDSWHLPLAPLTDAFAIASMERPEGKG